MSSEHNPPIGYLMHDVARLFRRRFEEVSKAHRLTLPQVRVLAQLAMEGPRTQVELGGRIDADPMTVSGILERLEKRGLIERLPDPSDSRAKLASVTPKGQALYLKVKSIGLELYEVALAGTDAEDRARLIATLNRIRSNLAAEAALEPKS